MMTLNLTGVWEADDGGRYYMRQLGTTVWWAGLSNDHGINWGLTFTNIFLGTIQNDEKTIFGSWVDVPRGVSMHSGTLTLEIVQPSPESDDESPPPDLGDGEHPIGGEHKSHTPYILELHRQNETGGFGDSSWRQFGVPFDATNISDIFDRVRRNDDNTMGEHLDIYKDNAVVFGHITESAQLNYPFYVPTTYCQFMQHPWWTEGGDPPDGDINFRMLVYRNLRPEDGIPLIFDLERQPDFWTDGWLKNPNDIRDKLNDTANNQPQNWIHPEIIMYGRTIDEDNCREDTLPLLPGWMEDWSGSVLLNGWPLSGQVDWGSSVWLLGRELLAGERNRVRVTGALSLDCHGHIDYVPPSGISITTRDCYGYDPTTHNVEIHPVYSIDILQNFDLPRPMASLTGVWAATDTGTYYVRQIGNAIWWLGLSRDQGLTFANIFHGVIQDNIITGQWADVRMGMEGARNSGSLSLLMNGQGPTSTSLIAMDTGVFQGHQWEKLYDYEHKFALIAFEHASASDPTFGWSDDSFQIYLNNVRYEVSPSNVQTFSQGSRAELGISALIELPTNAFLSLLVGYGGYQLYRWYENSTEFGDGDHTEGLSWMGNSYSPTSSDFSVPREGFPKHGVVQDTEDSQQRSNLVITYHITVVRDIAELPQPGEHIQ